MSLPENFSYNEAVSSLGAIGKGIKGAAQKISSAARPQRSKAVDPSRFSGLAQTAKRSAPAPQLGPATPAAPQLGPATTNYAAGAQLPLGTVSVPYGKSTRYEKFHPAIDIANTIGTPISAYTGGTVSDVVSGKKQGDRGYGNYVIVTDDFGNKHRYSHLDGSYVRVGQQIPQGFTLGSVGNTGQTYSTSGGTGAHLDYRIKDIYDRYIRPEKFLASR